jgi:hypothetical protein
VYAGPYPDGPFDGPFGVLFGPDGPFAMLLLIAVAVFRGIANLTGEMVCFGRGPQDKCIAARGPVRAGGGRAHSAFFVGFGVQAFYPAPEPPQAPPAGQEARWKGHPHSGRGRRPDPLDGPLTVGTYRNPGDQRWSGLGGVLTVLYGLVLALQAEGDVFRFLMEAVVLVVVLVAVYLRFPSGRTGSATG